jgi:hypothetical protein
MDPHQNFEFIYCAYISSIHGYARGLTEKAVYFKDVFPIREMYSIIEVIKAYSVKDEQY